MVSNLNLGKFLKLYLFANSQTKKLQIIVPVCSSFIFLLLVRLLPLFFFCQ